MIKLNKYDFSSLFLYAHLMHTHHNFKLKKNCTKLHNFKTFHNVWRRRPVRDCEWWSCYRAYLSSECGSGQALVSPTETTTFNDNVSGMQGLYSWAPRPPPAPGRVERANLSSTTTFSRKLIVDFATSFICGGP